MPQNYADYQKRAAERAQRQAAQGEGKSFQKVGFLKLKNDGDSALVRINLTKPEDLMLADYHQLGASAKYMKVECTGPGCPLCKAAESDPNISKAKSRVFVPMIVAYKQPDGTYSTPEPVIMDATAAGRNDFVKVIVNKLVDFAPLTDHVFKLTRNGIKLDTTYSLDYVPTFDNENIIAKDFTAFTNFRIDKHSYWVKSNEEINAYLETGQFPQVTTQHTTDAVPAGNAQPSYVAPATQAQTQTTEQKPAETDTPRRNPNFQAHW